LPVIGIELWIFHPISSLVKTHTHTADPIPKFVLYEVEVFVMIKIKMNSRFLFCREDKDERQKARLCWRGYVHIAR
jgi:hypothetical protein